MRSRKFKALGLALFGAVFLAACEEKNILEVNEPTPPVEVSVTPQTVTLEIGQTVDLVITVKNAQNTGVNITSNNTNVATVSGTRVTAVGAGTTTIEIVSQQDANAKAGVTVVVNPPAPPPEVSITLQPEDVEIYVGQSITLVATVSGSDNTNATCSEPEGSSSVLQRVANCSYVGVAPGTVVITATAAADTTKKATAVIKVSPRPEPKVSIQSIVYPITNIVVDPSNVSGDIVVNVEYDIPEGSGVETIEILLGGKVVASQAFSAVSAASVAGEGAAFFQWRVSTDAFCTTTDSTDPDAAFCEYVGQPRNYNGPTTLSVRAVRASGEVAAQISQELTLNNKDRFFARGTIIPVYSEAVGGSAVNPTTGRRYHEGSVKVDLFFIDYSRQALNQGSISIRLNTPGNPVQTAGLSRTFDRNTATGSGGVADVTSTNPLTITVNGQYEGGNPLPGSANVPTFTQWNGQPALPAIFAPGQGIPQETIFLDNQGPKPNSFKFTTQSLASASPIRCCLDNWLGREIRFASFYGTATEADLGVGVPSGTAHRTFHAGPASASSADIAESDPVETGQDLIDVLGLTPTATNDAYAAVVVTRDRLGNPSRARLQPNPKNPGNSMGGAVFGLDVVDPVIVHVAGVSTRGLYVETDPTQDINFAFQYVDETLESSGFGPNPVRVIRRTNFGATPTYAAVPGTYSIPAADGEHYFGVEAEVYDRGGNKSATLPERMVLRDGTAPTRPGGSPLVLPSSTQGNTVTYSVAVADNRDLLWAEGVTSYEGAPTGAGVGLIFPTARPTPLGTPWDAPNVTSATATVEVPFLRGIQLVQNGGGAAGNGGVAGATAHAPSATILTALGGGVRVRDAARHELTIVDEFTSPTPAPTPIETDPSLGGVIDFQIVSITPTTICNNAAGVGCSTTETQAEVVVQLRQHVAPGFQTSRIGEVYLYLAEDELAPYGGNVNHQPGNGDPIRFLDALDASQAEVQTTATERTFTWKFTIDASSLYWGDGTLPTTYFNPGAATSIFAIGVRTDEPTGLRTLNNTSLTIEGNNNDPFEPIMP